MSPDRTRILVRAAERPQLEQWVRATTTPQRVVWRSEIVLLALDGLSVADIAARVGVSGPTVRLWLGRFASGGAAALLRDDPGRGRHPAIDYDDLIARLRSARLIDATGKPASLREAARYLGVSPATVRRALSRHFPAS